MHLGPQADIFVASGESVTQFNMANLAKTNRQTVKSQRGQVLDIDFDPIKNMMYWIDGGVGKIFRAVVPTGNQTHSGQELDLDFDQMDMSPRGLAVDFIGRCVLT